MFEDTIVAIATSRMEAALSIIRLSGPHVFEVMSKIFKKDLTKVPSHTIHYGFIRDGKEVIDEVLVNVYHGKHTFTGENMVEINCHGSVFITNRVLETCLKYGARMANRGEFSERAFLNGRIDLAQAESISDLISAKTVQASRLALSGVRGNVSNLIKDLKEDLIKIITQIEVNIDYPEYDDVEELTSTSLIPLTSQFILKLDHILENARSGKLIKEGISTVIVGKPNVGKSSLLNALLQEDKAIVTDIAGTTRDIVEGSVNLGGIVLNMIDTAGIRETEDIVEKIGVEKSKEVVQYADLVLLVLDGSRPLDQEDEELLKLTKDLKRIIVINKSDMTKQIDIEGISISAKNLDIENLENEIKRIFNIGELVLNDEALISNSRHISLLEQAKISTTKAIDAMHMMIPTDLIVLDLYDAWKNLKEILGEEAKEDLLDELFSRFCIGK
ncbi:MAG: tRNA uridine-5-carboxymethylaminomethyl(34) synthesis GTPase MnmE [Erysipelotrichaceae bacterium]|nr:tRNA uridine-5-carboxymethylaminomethyl(34) synthesis GTPase MnmE [Erysipelotrichaceae bacterium]